MKNQLKIFNHKAMLPFAFPMLVVLLFFTSVTLALAENVITSGTKLIVTSGSKLVTVETLLIKNGATLNNSGTVIFKKGLTNEPPGQSDLGSGIAEFSGTENQTITGLNFIQDLVINNSAGVTMAGPTKVNGNLILNSGKVTLGDYELLIGPFGIISGTPSALAMVIVTGSGLLQKDFQSGFTGSFTFPVGDNTDTPEYSPVTISFNGATTVQNYIGVKLRNEKFPDPAVNGNYLKRYWMFNWYGYAVNCNITLQYVPEDVVGDESVISCTKIGGPTWTTYGVTNEVSHLLSATGLTSLGWYTGVRSNTAPVDNDVKDVTLAAGMTNCYPAQNRLTVAGAGSTFLVKNGGVANLVAGQSISLLDGTTVMPGGYLHAFISTDGNYCGALPGMLATLKGESETTGIETFDKNHWIRIYPNPTSDKVIVELDQNEAPAGATIVIYNMQGQKLLGNTFTSGSKFEFSMAGKPIGCYLFHVQSSGKSEIAKVIKN